MIKRVRAAIALGANLGDRTKTLQHAASQLQSDVLEGASLSSFYETEPWGILDQPKFLNAVLVGETEWPPTAILSYLKNLERELGRTTSVRNGPRVIDLDLLLWGSEIVKTEELTVPHPGLHERVFVLAPLRELWPDAVHPELGLTIEALYENLPSSAKKEATVVPSVKSSLTAPTK